MAKHFSAQNLIEPVQADEEYICASVGNTLEHARPHAERAINSTMVEAYEGNTPLLSGVSNSQHTVS